MDEVKKSLGEVRLYEQLLIGLNGQCFMQIPIVDSELRKAAGEEKEGN